MVLLIILAVVVLVTFVVLGILFYMLNQEGKKKEEEESAVRKFSLEGEQYKKRIQELEDELRTISQKAGRQSDEAKQMIETLTKENESLKLQKADLEQAQLESAKKAGFLEEEISRANAAVTELKPGPDEALRRELESLQYELIKARAQSSGLERVSFNYKNQLEDFFKKVNAAQATNDHLSQVKSQLEGMVEQIKQQNEELVKKDQLAQFELEKNRTRLGHLEREYEDLKVRAQQKDQQ